MTVFKSTRLWVLVWFIMGCMWSHTPLFAQDKKKPVKPTPPVVADKAGKLTYASAPNGDRIPDFSYAGYMASESSIPDVPVKITVPVKPGDATPRIQAALDYVAGLPASADGIRGAVLLEKGTYRVNGCLKMSASGVILRGSGMDDNGTILLAAGTDRETFIKVAGKNDRIKEKEVKISNAYVPVNAFTFNVASAGNFKVGDMVSIHRPSTIAWINKLGVASFGGGLGTLGWHPGDEDIYWDRKVTAVNGNSITVDAPLTTSLDTAYGGGFIAKYTWPGRINQIGIENVRLRSAYDAANPKDEAHRWMAITMENVSDAWVRQVTFEHFAGSAVFVLETANRVTVEDCRSLKPVSEIGGYRRNTFWTMGGQTLFQRLYSEYGYHDFGTGNCTPGPTAFVQCMSSNSYNLSGGLDSWASGLLFDIVNIDGASISFKNREQDGQGAGWNAANSMSWNCTAARIDNYNPPTAQNWAYGAWAQFGGDGYWESANSTISPRSFFYAQLSNRLNKDVSKQAAILYPESEPSSSPTVEQAAALLAAARRPATTMLDWINGAAKRNPISTNASGAKNIDAIGYKAAVAPKLAPAMTVTNGWLMRGNAILQGMHFEAPWWNGNVKPLYLTKTAQPQVTRWVPGRTGTGLTDDITEVANWMQQKNMVVFEHNYGLWYERRRDDHERIRRADGDVWAPFYELPFARSGSATELAYDGLSKYDLTKYNLWYWSRLKQFADLADQRGLVLFHQNFFQHNIIEAGAHYTDFPWRTANNINHTGFPEPVNYAGDKRQFMAEQFYDEKDPARHNLLVAYINKCMDNFAGNNGVIQSTAAEFTGPLHFMQFWVETVKQWETVHKQKQIIALSATKDVQDAILADPTKASVINAIDIRFWWYQGDGKLFAPLGGKSLAPRQQERLEKLKAVTFESVYQAVHEYKVKYPDKAVLFSADGFDHNGWAVFIAGGSLPVLPATTDKDLLTAAGTMHPADTKDVYALGNAAKGYIAYFHPKDTFHPKVDDEAMYTLIAIDAKTGMRNGEAVHLKGKEFKDIKAPYGDRDGLIWLKRD